MSPELLHYDWDGTKHNGMIAEEIDPATETIEFRPSSDDDATLDEDESVRTQNCEVQEAVPMEEDPPLEPVQDNPASIPLPEDNDPKDTPAPINDVQTTTIPDTPKAASDKESEHHLKNDKEKPDKPNVEKCEAAKITEGSDQVKSSFWELGELEIINISISTEFV